MKVLHWLVLVLVVVGAINWGFVGFFDFDVVHYVLGAYPTAIKVVYAVVGVAGLAMLASFFCCCGHCCKGAECCDTGKKGKGKKGGCGCC